VHVCNLLSSDFKFMIKPTVPVSRRQHVSDPSTEGFGPQPSGKVLSLDPCSPSLTSNSLIKAGLLLVDRQLHVDILRTKKKSNDRCRRDCGAGREALTEEPTDGMLELG